MNQGFFPALGDFVARFRWLVLAAWIVFVGVSVLGARQVKGELVSGGINVPGSESNRGEAVLADEFDRRPTRTAAAIFTSDKFKVTDQQYRDGVEKALKQVQDTEGVTRVRSFYVTGLQRLVSEDEHTTYAPIELSGTEEEAKAKIPDIRDALRRDLSPDIDEAYIIGFPAVSYDISAGSAEDLHHAELYSLPLTIFLLLLVFGTIVAAGLPVMLGRGGGGDGARAAVPRRAADGDLDLRDEHGVDDRSRARHRLLAADGQPLPRRAGEGHDGAPGDGPDGRRRPASRSCSRA